MKRLLCMATAGLFAVSSFGVLITDGTMDGSMNDTGASMGEWKDAGLGWTTYNNTTHYNISGGEMVNVSKDNDAVYQLNAVTTETGNQWTFNFDFSSENVVSGTAKLTYQVCAWSWASGTPAAGDDLFEFINGPSDDVRLPAGVTGAAAYDLLDGSSTTVSDTDFSVGTVFLDAGGATSESISLNLGTSNMQDFEVVGVRLWFADDATGSSLDNVSIVVPEPATLGLVAAFGGAVLFIRRRIAM